MADIAKTAKVVSTNSVGVCELTSGIEADSLDILTTNNHSDSFNDLSFNLPSTDDGTSLQELIDSELALRISGDVAEEEDDVESTRVQQIDDPFDVNAQFILEEKTQAFQSYTGNDTFFFSTLDEAQLSTADPFTTKFDQDPGDEDVLLPVNGLELDQAEMGDGNDIFLLDSSPESECVTGSAAIKDKLELTSLSSFDPFATIEVKSESNDTISSPSACADADLVNLPSDNDVATVVTTKENGEAESGYCLLDFDEEAGGFVEESVLQESETNDIVSVDTVNNSMIGINNSSNDVDLVITNKLDGAIDAGQERVASVVIPQIDIFPPDEAIDEQYEDMFGVEAEPFTEEGGGFDAWTTVAEAVIEEEPDEEPRLLEDEIAAQQDDSQQEVASQQDDSQQDLASQQDDSQQDLASQQDIASNQDDSQQDLASQQDDSQQEVASQQDDSQQDLALHQEDSQQDLSLHQDDSQQDIASHQDVASQQDDSQQDETSQDSVVVHGDDVVFCSKTTDSSVISSCSDSESSEIVTSSSTEKKSVKKKKSEGGESIKTKKTKKNKKSDAEKENFSVMADIELTRVESRTNDYDSGSDIATSETATIADMEELANVSVKNLKSTYSYPAGTQSPREIVKEIDEDILHCGSIQSLKQTYCSEATKSFAKGDCLDRKEKIATGISIKQLRRSFGDLTQLCDNDEVDHATNGLESSQVKSSFSKFDQLGKKTVLHVRSVDASKAQKQFNQSATATPEQMSNCRSCGKQVFQMEQVKAERAVWHKNCFRCKECNKQLTVDIYSSHEGQLYCKPHFRELFKPKAVVETEENNPPSDKPDLGLEELSALNVKSRYQVFEKTENSADVERSPSSISVKRSPSILSKLARFQAKGMDVGVTDDSLNGIPYEDTSSSSEEEEEGEDADGEVDKDLIRANRKHRERPVSFTKMEDIKCKWETGQAQRRAELREERKHEIAGIRSRLFLGHQGKMKEMYEQAVIDSDRSTQKKDVDIRSDKAKSIKERFERGEAMADDEDDGTRDENSRKAKEDELEVFEAGISKKSRSLFLELDATAAKQAPLVMSPVKTPNQVREDTRKVESPEREIYRDPEVVRAEDKHADIEVMRSNTASKMLSIFRQMEENATKEDLPDGPKPLKRFTPPPDYTHDSETSEEESEEDEDEEEEEEDEEETNPNIIRASDKIEDEFLKQAQTAARAKVLRAKFERWEEKENKANATNGGNMNGLDIEQSDQASIDTTKSLRARFESLKNDTQQSKERAPRPQVNRFVEIQTNYAEFCSSCEKKVYPLERVETGGKIFHKQCFRCLQCNSILRMDTYTLNSGKLYCIPHFKQLFITKGNYDEGFGLDQHKRKWSLARNDSQLFSNGNHIQ